MAKKRMPPRDSKGRFKKRSATRSAGKKRNPAGVKASAADRKALDAAVRLAKSFHGTAQGHVVELSARERKPLPRYVTVAGDLDDFTYAPSSRSKRGGNRWRHESGDRGPGKARAKKKPLLVVDPNTKRPAVIANGSPMRFGSKGFVG